MGNTYTTVAITAPCSVTATFVALVTYNVVLEGAQEIPANASTAIGSGTAVVDTVNNTITLNLAFSGLTGGVVTGAHLHGAAARGVAASVKIALTDTVTPITETLTFAEGDQADILAGNWYVNIHTTSFPNGEIRGQLDNVLAANKTLTVALSGTGGGTVTGTGINCGVDCTESYIHGSSVVLTAGTNVGSTFTGWSGAGCSGTGSCTITMDFLKSVTATFDLTQYPLTIARNGNGSGSVDSVPAGIACGADCTELYTFGSVVTLTASPGLGSTFTGWSGGGCSGTGACNVLMSAAQSVTATFTLNIYTLTVTNAGTGGGSIASAPAGISCGADCNEPYNHGTVVTLTATANLGSTFTGWSGSGCSGTATCIVTMTAAQTVTAGFALNNYSLTIIPAGNGTGTVNSAPAGISCGADCTEPYTFGTGVTLTASPGLGSTFTGWSGGGCSGTGTCNVTINSAQSVTATFTLNIYTLTVTRAGTGSGSVSSVPAGITCGADCSEPYNHGTTITLTASPAVGSTFSGWSGAACSGTGNCVVTLTAAQTATASFALNTFTVTASAGSNGSITPTGMQTAGFGSTPSFMLAPASGYFAVVTGTCGGTLTANNFTTNPVTSSCTVDAAFTQITFAVTPSAGANGSINPNTVQNVAQGAAAAFMVSPNIGYSASVTGCGGTLAGSPER